MKFECLYIDVIQLRVIDFIMLYPNLITILTLGLLTGVTSGIAGVSKVVETIDNNIGKQERTFQ